MIGLAIGLGALGFFIAHRARRRAWAHGYGGGYGGGGCGRGHGGWGPGHYGRGRHDWLRFVSHHLDTTPAQERVIQREVRTLLETARDARRSAMSGRADLARAVGGPVFDTDAANAGFAGVTAAASTVQTQAIESLRKIHEVLDDEQRKELSQLIEGGRFRFGGMSGGPYR
jgi:Spy/CpxP family protein refolding chaperone